MHSTHLGFVMKKFLFYTTILILGFMSGVYMETCPVKEAIHPCECEEGGSGDIMVSCYSVFSIKMREVETLQQALSGLAGKSNVHLYLSSFNTTRFPSNLFSGIGIKKLDFASCYMDSWTSDDQPRFLGLENHLEMREVETLQQALRGLAGKSNVHLYLSSFNTSRFLSNLFSGIGIKKLDFASCYMDSRTSDDQPRFLGLENHLEELVIRLSNTVPAKLNFGPLKKLKKVQLSYNKMTELRDDWFSNDLASLEFLYIFENKIEKIGSNVFSRLSNLKTLWLTGNQLGHIERSMFPTTADRLEKLDLEGNALTDLPEDLFNRMPSLKSVSLDRNEITTLDERTWSPVWQQLWTLDVSGNNIYCDDRLNWISKSKKKPRVFGYCSAPKKFEKWDLEQFFEARSQ